MPKFTYTGQGPDGPVKGTIDAANRQDALVELRKRNVRVKTITVTPFNQDIQFSRPYPGGMDMSLFCSQYALMAEAGVSQSDMLSALLKTTSNQRLRDALQDVLSRTLRGQDITVAMAQHPRIFDRSFIALIKASIRTNSVPITMRRLSVMYERNVKISQGVKGALVQPGITVSVALIVVVLLSLIVIPQMKTILEGLNVPLPTITRLLISVSDTLLSPLGLVPLALIIALIIGVRSFARTTAGRTKLDQWILRLPKVGDLIRLGALARVNRTLATLLSNGIGKVEAIGIASEASGNQVIEDILLDARRNVERGNYMYTVLERHPKIFPATIIGMVNTGEEQGELAQMLDRVSDFYERQVEVDAQNLTKYIEPAMFIFIGILVGGLVLAVLTPLSSVIGNLSR